VLENSRERWRHDRQKAGLEDVYVQENVYRGEQWSILEKFRGIYGNSDSEIVKYVAMSYLSEKTFVKQEIEKN